MLKGDKREVWLTLHRCRRRLCIFFLRSTSIRRYVRRTSEGVLCQVFVPLLRPVPNVFIDTASASKALPRRYLPHGPLPVFQERQSVRSKGAPRFTLISGHVSVRQISKIDIGHKLGVTIAETIGQRHS